MFLVVGSAEVRLLLKNVVSGKGQQMSFHLRSLLSERKTTNFLDTPQDIKNVPLPQHNEKYTHLICVMSLKKS